VTGYFGHRLVRGLKRRAAFLDVALDILDHDDRVVDDDADREHQAEQRKRVNGKAEQIEHGEGADNRHRHGDQWIDRGAPGLQEQDHHQHDQRDRLKQRVDDGRDRFSHEDRGIIIRSVVHAGRELPGELVHLRDHRVPRRQRVGAGRLKHADDRRVVMVELATQGVVAGAKLDARDVRKPHDLAARAGFQHDLAELLRRAQAALRVDCNQEIAAALDRFGAELASRDLDVLLLDGAHHVARGHAARSDLVRTEPDAHRIVAATEHPYLADAGNARELVLDPDIGVVAQVKRIILAVRDQRDQREEGRRLLLRGHPEADHFRRQARQRLGNAVLHVHLRLVRIGAGGEGDRHLQHAVGAGHRLHVHHVLDAVDLLLERRRHGLGDDLGVGARIGRLHDDGGRNDLGIFADRQ
jgi:hypothetical protein